MSALNATGASVFTRTRASTALTAEQAARALASEKALSCGKHGARRELLVAGGLDALGRRLRGQRRHSALLRRAVAVAGARARGLLLLRIQLPPAGQCSVPACCARKPP